MTRAANSILNFAFAISMMLAFPGVEAGKGCANGGCGGFKPKDIVYIFVGLGGMSKPYIHPFFTPVDLMHQLCWWRLFCGYTGMNLDGSGSIGEKGGEGLPMRKETLRPIEREVEGANEIVGRSTVRPRRRFAQGSADHEPHRFYRLLEDLPRQDLDSPPTITRESASAQIMHRVMYILPVR